MFLFGEELILLLLEDKERLKDLVLSSGLPILFSMVSSEGLLESWCCQSTESWQMSFLVCLKLPDLLILNF